MLRSLREDPLAVKTLVDDWAIWRDAGQWEKLLTVWHDDGRMNATWFQGLLPISLPPAKGVGIGESPFCTLWAERQSTFVVRVQ
jgi:asparagine synthetase A